MARSGSKRSKRRQQKHIPPVTEEFRIRIHKVVQDFQASDEQEYTFEPGMSNPERATLHVMCRKMGMVSKSFGKGDSRCVYAYKSATKKKKNRFDQNEENTIPSLTLPCEAKNMLQDLFIHHPPDESELCEGALNNYNEASGVSKRKPDSSFSRPSIPKYQLAKNLELLAKRMNENPELKKIAEDRVKLPIASYKDSITSMLETQQVVLIAGETGCGKTTQVPQYILDHMWGKGKNCKVVCTQPRRISAISVAERISCERGENVGDTVGYKIRLESKGGQQSSIIFCTNGVLLKLLVGRGANSGNGKAKPKSSMDGIMGITHIIVDEIHERDRFSDFMLAIFRDLLPAYPHVHLILMSATFDAERFSNYFGGCPVIQVPGFTHPVKTFYLEDVLAILKSSNDNHPNIADLSIAEEDSTPLTEDYKNALDESMDLALSSDECDPLVELISSRQTSQVYNYQHSETGISPLMVLAGKGRVGDLYMLLSFGADCSLTDNNGSSALDYAQRENQQQCYKILKEHVEKGSSKAPNEELLENYLSSINPELIDTVLIERLLRKICTGSNEGAILVFLPGWDDINRTREKLFASKFFSDSSKFNIISLHSMVPSSEQKKVFNKSPPGVRKIILSTNIAETAVTIDDVVYVIDSGRMKEKSYDPYSNVSTLHSSWISKASAKQREGRAGRCQPGICYHLFSKAHVASLLDYQVPEIRRIPIEELCLQVKLLDPQLKIADFLHKTLDPPVAETVRNGIIVLQDIGALSQDEKLTELGEKLGVLPVHPSTSKMLLFSILMKCVEPALTLACSADYREPFILPMAPEEKKKAALAKAELASVYGGCSDQLAVIAAFECWRCAKNKGCEYQFCSKYYVSNNIMSMLAHMRMQLQTELVRVGFISEDMMTNCNKNAQDPGIIRAVLTAGGYPMFGRFLPRRKQDRSAVVETANGARVRLHPHSLNFGSAFSSDAIIVYDEVTRGDAGMYIKNCSLVGPYPLVLLSMELAVVPGEKEEDVEDESGDCGSEDEDEGEPKKSDVEKGDVMSSPEKAVTVVVDRWLRYKSTALEVAQIYCLRERLTAAMLFKVKNPESALPPALEASMYAIGFLLSGEGLSSIKSDNKNPGKFSLVTPSDYLKSLMSDPHSARSGSRSLSHRGRGGSTFHSRKPRGGAVANAPPNRRFSQQSPNCGPNPNAGPGPSGNRFGSGGPARHQSFKRRRPARGK